MTSGHSPLKEGISKCRTGLWVVAGLSAVINLLMLTQPIFMLQVFNRVLQVQVVETLVFLLVIALLALAVMALLMWVRSRILNRMGAFLDESISQSALERSADQIIYGSKYGTQAVRDVGAIKGFVTGPGALAFFDAPWVPLQLGVLFLLHPTLGAISLIAAVGLAGFAFVNEVITKRVNAQSGTTAIQNHQFIDAAMRNVEVLQGMGMLRTVLGRWGKTQQQLRDVALEAQDVTAFIQALARFFRFAIQIVIMATGAYLVIQNQLTPGGMIAGSIIMGRALAPLENGLIGWKQFGAAREGFNRLEQQFASPPMRTDSKLHIGCNGHLTVEGVSFVFPGAEKPTLEGVTFEAKPGEALAIIGHSAAGKTTLAKLIMGVLKPNRGNVRLDTAEVFHWDREEFGQHVGYLPQNIELFPATVEENIGRLGEYDPEQVVRAAQLAGAHEMILRLPHGYQTQVGADGTGLSGGQQQRIGLARAFYGCPKFVLLDEPNSNLDELGNAGLLKGIQIMKEMGTTLVLVTHSKLMLSCVERTAVLQDGKLSLWGPTEAVFEKIRVQRSNES